MCSKSSKSLPFLSWQGLRDCLAVHDSAFCIASLFSWLMTHAVWPLFCPTLAAPCTPAHLLNNGQLIARSSLKTLASICESFNANFNRAAKLDKRCKLRSWILRLSTKSACGADAGSDSFDGALIDWSLSVFPSWWGDKSGFESWKSFGGLCCLYVVGNYGLSLTVMEYDSTFRTVRQNFLSLEHCLARSGKCLSKYAHVLDPLQ
jgi:hypothetical protein